MADVKRSKRAQGKQRKPKPRAAAETFAPPPQASAGGDGAPASRSDDAPAGQADAAPAPTDGVGAGRDRRGRVIALTGAAGFIGTRLVGQLEADPDVREILAIDLRLPRTAGPKTRFVYADLTQPSAPTLIAEALTHCGADSLVHLAFLAHPSHTRAWAHELEAIGTMHVLSACSRRQVRKLVLWSQTTVYGAHPKNPNFLTEDHPLRGHPGSRFVTDKVEAERQFERYAHEHPGSVVTRLRTCTLFGPTVQNFFTRYLDRAVLPVMMGTDPLMQLLHEDDVIEAFRLALDGDHPGAYNIVGDGVLPLSTILRILGKVTIPVPHGLAAPLARALWTAQVVDVPPAFLDYLRYVWVADGGKARTELGFRPRYTTLECVLAYAGALGPAVPARRALPHSAQG